MLVKIAVTGAPCSGKTEFINTVISEHPEILVIPEVASIVKSTGLKFATENERIIFQKTVLGLQMDFERQMESATYGEVSYIVLCDRGTVDAVAYCKDSFITENNINIAEETASYGLAIFLKLPESRNQYDSFCKDNLYRDEDYDTSKALEAKQLSLWQSNSNMVIIPYCESAIKKYEAAHNVLLEFLKSNGRYL